MDSNFQPPPPPIDGGGGDWRSQLQPDSRQRIVNKIMETLKRHLPFSGQEGLQELKQIAIRFEEKIYSAATSQSDYLRKISLKMLTMESKSQNTLPNALPPNSAGVSRNPQDTVASQNMQSQMPVQPQSVPLQMAPNQSQARQQISSQSTQNNIASGGMQTNGLVQNTIPTNSLAQNSMPNIAQNPNLQNMSGMSQSSMGNTMNQGIASNMFPNNAQRQMQGRQQQVSQQSQNSQQFIYQQQLQHQILKQKMQQQNNVQQNSLMQPSMISGLQQNQQQPSIQQPNQQSVIRQQHQPQQPQQAPIQQQHQPQQQVLGPQGNAGNMQQSQLIGQQQNSGNMQQSQLIGQQQNSGNMQQSQLPNSGSMQQSQLIGQQANTGNMLQSQLIGQQPTSGNMQQSQLIGQHGNISDIQQQQQQRMLGQQNNAPNQHFAGQQNVQNMHQQQLGQQGHVGGQQLIGTQTQSGNASMQTNQHSLQHMVQQTKVPGQQQTLNATSILPGGMQQSQPQQQLMSQHQSQPTQLQQQLGLQQQQPNYLQQNMQRMPNMNPLLQQQNLIDQKLFQSQRATPEAPSTSLDSTAQTSSANGGDWQEEVYQKIKSMKDLYYADLNEMYQKISNKLQQHDSVPQQPKIDQIEKLRLFKDMLDRLMQVLQITKNNILLSHREKLPSFEKQIVSLLNSNRPRKPVPPGQLGQTIIPQQRSMYSQIPQAQSHDGGMNPQLQSMNLPGSVASMQQNTVPPTLQHGSVSSVSAITSSQQNTQSSLQPNSNLDPGQASAPSSMQQGAISSMNQNLVGASQQANMTSLQPQSGVSLLQQNVNNLHSNSNMLQNQQLKQQHDQQLKQHMQNKHMQQQMLHKQQLLQQQAKQQHASQMQAQAHQMPQLHQINDVNEKVRQLRSGGAFPQHHLPAQRFMNQQLKPGGASFPVPSSQLLNAGSPHMMQHSSLQIDPQNLQQSVPKGSGTPLHSANSPFVPSPSTPLAPSPVPGDNEKPAISSLSNAVNVGHLQTNGAPQSLSIGTPGISLSPLFECAGAEGIHGNASTISGKSSVTEQPIERLLRAVKSISPKALSAAVNDISSVVSMVDRIAGSAPGNGSRATVGEDLVAMTKCRLQARNFLTQDGNSGTKRMRRYTSAMPLNVGASIGSMNDSLKQLNGPDTPELESTATSGVKKARIEVNHALVEELREINERYIDTVVDISDEDMDPSVVSPAAGGGEGTIVKYSYNAITLGPSLRSQYMSAQMSPIQPLKFLVPASYPNCSPILLDKLPVGVGNEHEDLSVKAKSRFSISLRSLSEPMSLKDIARTWDDCARAVISEYAQQSGGGTFSSKYGVWENCLSAT